MEIVMRLFILTTLAVLASVANTQGQENANSEKGAFLWDVSQPSAELLTTDKWYISNFSIEKPSFRTAWDRDNVELSNTSLTLSLHPAPNGHEKEFLGSEVQFQTPTHYGRYEVVMTAARGEGIISSFFTYTGAYFGTPHDEIDFEFLGRDTTKVWLNGYTDGQSLPGQWIELGFDAADEPHLYAFEWTPDSITWFVDGRELWQVTAADATLPSLPGKVYINIWAGGPGQKNWSGSASPQQTARAQYFCMSHQPLGFDTPQCSDRSTP